VASWRCAKQQICTNWSLPQSPCRPCCIISRFADIPIPCSTIGTIFKLTEQAGTLFAAEDPAASPSAVGRKAATNIHRLASMRQIRPRKSRPRAVIGRGGATVAMGRHRYPKPVALLPCINTASAGGELTHSQLTSKVQQQYRSRTRVAAVAW
jgi:hypothetical protein